MSSYGVKGTRSPDNRLGRLDMSARIHAIKADITTLAVDAIVNAANSSLLGRTKGAELKGPASESFNDQFDAPPP